MFHNILILGFLSIPLFPVKCDKLLAVTTLVRHGERLGSYDGFDPNDPYLDLRMENPSDELLNLGVQELYNVGTWMRQNFSNFLSLKYNASEIYVQSIGFDRCLMSVEALLAALYPPVGDEIWNPNLLWQPIPIHSMSPVKYDILLQWTSCPFFTLESRKALALHRKIKEENKDLLQFLTEETGSPVSLSNTLMLYNILEGEKLINLTLPLWTHGVIRDLKPLVEASFMIQTMDKNLRRLRSGPLVHRILTQFERAISRERFGTTHDIYRKMMLYSTADMTEYFLADSLNVLDIGIVNYAFSLYFELWEADNGKHFVDIFFRNSTDINAPSHHVNIDGLGSSVSFDDFKRIAGRTSITLTEWDDLCHSLMAQENSTPK